MIALLNAGFFETFETCAAFLWAGLFLLGGASMLPLRKKRAQRFLAGAGCALCGLCELAAWLPTPAAGAGDGYAVTQDIGLIGASFLVPFTGGILSVFLMKALLSRIKG